MEHGTVLEYKGLLEKFKDKKRMVLSFLEELDEMHSINFAILKETGIGKTVNGFRKVDGEVGELARKIVAKWKSLTADSIKNAKSVTPAKIKVEKDILNLIGTKMDTEITASSAEATTASLSSRKRSISPSVYSATQPKIKQERSSQKDKESNTGTESNHKSVKQRSNRCNNESETSSHSLNQTSVTNEKERKHMSSIAFNAKDATVKFEKEENHQISKKFSSNEDFESQTFRPGDVPSSDTSTTNTSKLVKVKKEKDNNHSIEASGNSLESLAMDTSSSSSKLDAVHGSESDKHYSNRHNNKLTAFDGNISAVKIKKERNEKHSKKSRDKTPTSAETCDSHMPTPDNFSTTEQHQSNKHTSKFSFSESDGIVSLVKVNQEKNDRLPRKSHDKSSDHSSSSSAESCSPRKRKHESESCEISATTQKSSPPPAEKVKEKSRSHKSKKSKSHKSKHKSDEKPSKSSHAKSVDVSFEQSLASIKYPNLTKKKKKADNLEQQIAKSVAEVPLPSTYLNDLPELLTDYKPLHRSAAVTTDSNRIPAANPVFEFKDIKASSRSDAVYSGRRRGPATMQSLYQLCIQVLSNNIDGLGYVGCVPYSILNPVLSKATPQQLFNIEEYNAEFTKDTDDLWRGHCNKDFKGQQREEFESWRELYLRKFEEREKKFEMLQNKIAAKEQQKQMEVRKSQVAYVMSSQPKPPREVRRQQAKYGTGSGSVESTARASAIMKNETTLKSPASGSRATSAVKPLASAPLMKKAKRFMSKLHHR